MILLDTNVLSEMMRPAPTDAVLRWIAGRPASLLYTTCVTQAEILFGLALLPEGRRRDGLMAAVDLMFVEDFGGRILPFDSAAAQAFASIAADRRWAGRPTGTFDAQIAAIARSRGAVLATRNVTDFQECGLVLVNPWEG